MYILISHVVVFIAGLIKLPIYSTYFTTSEIGNYSLTVSAIAYLDVILLSWISSSFWRFIYEGNIKRSINDFAYLFLTSSIFLGIIGLIITTILGVFFFKFDKSLILLILAFVNVLVQQVTSFFLMMLQSEHQTKKWCFAISIQSVFSLLLFLGLTTIWKTDLITIFISSIVINIMLIVIGIGYFRDYFRLLSNSWTQLKNIKNFISYSFQSTLVNIFLVVLINADRFLIDAYKGKSDTGIYSLVYSVAFVGFSFVIQAFTNIFLPYFNKSTITNYDRTVAKNIIKLYLLIFTPLCLFLVLYSRSIIQLLLPENYHSHFKIFSWVIAGIYLYGLANFYEIRLKLLNRIKIVLATLFFVALVNIIGNVLFLKNSGIEWAAQMTFYSYALLLFIVLLLNRDHIKELQVKKELRWLIIATVIIFATYLVSFSFVTNMPSLWTLLTSVWVLLLVYFILYKKLKGVFLEGISMLESTTTKF